MGGAVLDLAITGRVRWIQIDAIGGPLIACRSTLWPLSSRMTQQTASLRIAELETQVGKAVTVRGWVTHVRSSGKVAFAVIRDGTGVLQAVLVKSQVTPEVWAAFGELTTETSVSVTGEVKAEPRAPGGYEIGATDL